MPLAGKQIYCGRFADICCARYCMVMRSITTGVRKLPGPFRLSRANAGLTSRLRLTNFGGELRDARGEGCLFWRGHNRHDAPATVKRATIIVKQGAGAFT